MKQWLIVLALFAAGCGGGDTEEEILNEVPEGLHDTSETLEETRVEPQIGDTVCEGYDVFLIANGGVLVFMETCTDGLTCVAEAEGCACVPNCEGLTCGDDGCGGSCGTCNDDLLCHLDGVCREDCLPKGDGKFLGSHIRQLNWQKPPSGGFALHDFCQEKQRIVMVEVAGW